MADRRSSRACGPSSRSSATTCARRSRTRAATRTPTRSRSSTTRVRRQRPQHGGARAAALGDEGAPGEPGEVNARSRRWNSARTGRASAAATRSRRAARGAPVGDPVHRLRAAGRGRVTRCAGPAGAADRLRLVRRGRCARRRGLRGRGLGHARQQRAGGRGHARPEPRGARARAAHPDRGRRAPRGGRDRARRPPSARRARTRRPGTGRWRVSCSTGRSRCTRRGSRPRSWSRSRRRSAARSWATCRPREPRSSRSSGRSTCGPGRPIVYTSGDSVFQIACHTDVVPLETLYEWCRDGARLLVGEHAVGRVIARPFDGEPGAFVRPRSGATSRCRRPGRRCSTSRRRRRGRLRRRQDPGHLRGPGLTEAVYSDSNDHGVDLTLEYLRRPGPALVFTNLVDFDSKYGHRNDPEGYAAAVEAFDSRVPELVGALDGGVLFLTGDHGCDPTTPSTDHSRERTPLLAAGLAGGPYDVGTRETFADLGQRSPSSSVWRSRVWRAELRRGDRVRCDGGRVEGSP